MRERFSKRTVARIVVGFMGAACVSQLITNGVMWKYDTCAPVYAQDISPVDQAEKYYQAGDYTDAIYDGTDGWKPEPD